MMIVAGQFLGHLRWFSGAADESCWFRGVENANESAWSPQRVSCLRASEHAVRSSRLMRCPGRRADRDCERALAAFGGGFELPECRDGFACVMVAWGGRLFGVLVERGLRGGQFRERPQDRPHGFRQLGLGAHVAKHSMIARHVLGLRFERFDAAGQTPCG